jgi:trimethylamine:corrinoid methyltransferase-like protein
MVPVRYRLPRVLTDEQIELIMGEGIAILDKIGIECHHEGIAAIFDRHPGAKVKDGRFLFSEKLCREYVEKMRRLAKNEPLEEETGPIKLKAVGPWTGINVVDLDTGQVRPGTRQDMIDGTKLIEALGIEGRKLCAPVAPNDVPGRLQCLVMCKDCWKYSSRTGGGIASGAEEVRIICEMAAIANVKPPYTYVEFCISPLTFNVDALDLVYKLLGREELKALAVSPGPIPSLGGTGPCLFKSVMAQSFAEGLGGSILVDILTKGERSPLTGGMTAVGTDMRYGAVNFSSPESIMLLQMGFEIGSYVTGVFGIGGAMRTIGKLPDAQSAAEKMMCALVGALSGARHFCDLGQLSIDDTFSLEQLVIDKEILDSVERFVNGFAFEKDADTVGIIRESIPERNFFTHPTTLENFRNYYWHPQMFERRMIGPWQADGSPTIREKARRIAREKIAAQPMRVDENTAKKLDALFEKAAKGLAGK